MITLIRMIRVWQLKTKWQAALYQLLDRQLTEIIRDPESVQKKIMPYLAELVSGSTQETMTNNWKLITGSSQNAVLSALMNNFDTARDAAEAAVNSTGSALQAQEEYEKGIRYSLDRLKASYQEFANHIKPPISSGNPKSDASCIR